MTATPTAEERSAVDDVIGAPETAWEGGGRSALDLRTAQAPRTGGRCCCRCSTRSRPGSAGSATAASTTRASGLACRLPRPTAWPPSTRCSAWPSVRRPSCTCATTSRAGSLALGARSPRKPRRRRAARGAGREEPVPGDVRPGARDLRPARRPPGGRSGRRHDGERPGGGPRGFDRHLRRGGHRAPGVGRAGPWWAPAAAAGRCRGRRVPRRLPRGSVATRPCAGRSSWGPTRRSVR